VKVPLFSLHILTAGQLDSVKKKAVEECRELTAKQMSLLLEDNAKLRIFVFDMKRKLKKHGLL